MVHVEEPILDQRRLVLRSGTSLFFARNSKSDRRWAVDTMRQMNYIHNIVADDDSLMLFTYLTFA